MVPERPNSKTEGGENEQNRSFCRKKPSTPAISRHAKFQSDLLAINNAQHLPNDTA
jgi:hypothetical protein